MAELRPIFVAYATEDEHIVRAHLEQEMGVGYRDRTFFARLAIPSGAEWKTILAEQLSQCDEFWVYWSPAASRSEWVPWECEEILPRVKNGSCKLCALRINTNSTPPALGDYNFRLLDHYLRRHPIPWFGTTSAFWLGGVVALLVPPVGALIASSGVISLAWWTVLFANVIHLIWAGHHIPHAAEATGASMSVTDMRNFRWWLRRIEWDRPMTDELPDRRVSHPMAGELGAACYWIWPAAAWLSVNGTVGSVPGLLGLTTLAAVGPFVVAYLSNYPVAGNLYPLAYVLFFGTVLAAVVASATQPNSDLVAQVLDMGLTPRVLIVVAVGVILSLGVIFVRETIEPVKSRSEARFFFGTIAVFVLWAFYLFVVALPITSVP